MYCTYCAQVGMQRYCCRAHFDGKQQAKLLTNILQERLCSKRPWRTMPRSLSDWSDRTSEAGEAVHGAQQACPQPHFLVAV